MTAGNAAPVDGRVQQVDGSDRYSIVDGAIEHRLAFQGLTVESRIAADAAGADAKGAWWLAYLAGHRPEALNPIGTRLRTVDLFCGPGGLANGIHHLCDELGVKMVSELVVDQDEEATVVYAANHTSRRRAHSSVRSLVDYGISRRVDSARFAYSPEIINAEMAEALHGVDLVLAGPPCQGHSNLNNQTRRNDPRNDLYLSVPAFAVAIGAPMCIIENVPAVLNDSQGVVKAARQLFESEGYGVTEGTLSATDTGWPQSRARHFLVARRDLPPIPISAVSSLLRDTPRSLWWVIGHLEDETGDDLMRQVTLVSAENRARIDWLFDNDSYDLALAERPESHREGTTYTAVYGRLRKDQPAPTITTGFMSPGRGRFTHPTRRRVLTAREAARLQGFPDNYRFVPDPSRPPSRAKLAKWIGDAVPMPLGYAAGLAVLGRGLPAT